MDLDTALTKYTSERFLDGDPLLELITARHVLSHTSGLWHDRMTGRENHLMTRNRQRLMRPDMVRQVPCSPRRQIMRNFLSK
jgi:CubicO group peptidase (beta-lactamase class C family)